MKEVYPGIFSIEQKGILKLLKPPVNIYVITGSDGLIFDAGYGSRSSISQFSKKLQEINRICQERGVENNINRILLSHAHADHFSGLKPLRKKYGFKIILTEQMASIIKSRSAYAKSFSMKKPESSGIFSGIKKLFMGIKSFIEIAVYVRYWGVAFVNDPDIVINQNTNISINNEEWEIFPSPGHAADHITLYNKEKGIFFSGDNVLKSVNVWLGPPRLNIDDYKKTINEFMALKNLQLILPGHGNPITEPYVRLDEVLKWRKKRTSDVKEFVEGRGGAQFSIDEILKALYPAEGKIKRESARGWVELTIENLMKKGLVKRGQGRNLFSVSGE